MILATEGDTVHVVYPKHADVDHIFGIDIVAWQITRRNFVAGKPHGILCISDRFDPVLCNHPDTGKFFDDAVIDGVTERTGCIDQGNVRRADAHNPRQVGKQRVEQLWGGHVALSPAGSLILILI